MSEGPLPLPALEKPIEPIESEQARADEESPMEGGNIVAPEHVVDGEPSESPSMTREGFAVSPRLPSTLVNIDDLPEELAATLRPMDINGDGKITLTELVHGAVMQHEQRKKVRLSVFSLCSALRHELINLQICLIVAGGLLSSVGSRVHFGVDTHHGSFHRLGLRSH